MALSLGFLLKADTKQATEALESLAAKTEAVTAGMSGNFSKATSDLKSSLLSSIPTFGLVAGAVAGIGTALYEMANKASEAGDKLWIASKATGASVEMLQGLALAGKEAGVTFERVQRSMVHFATATSDLEKPTGAAGKALAELGIQGKDLADFKLKSLDDKFYEVIERLSHMKEGGEKTAIAAALLGARTEALIASLGGGAKALKEMRDEATKMSGITSEVAQKDHEFQEQLILEKVQLSGLVNQLEQKTIPIFSAFLKAINSTGFAFRDLGLEIVKTMFYMEMWRARLTFQTANAERCAASIEKINKEIDNNRKEMDEAGKSAGAAAKFDAALKEQVDDNTESEKKHTAAMKGDAIAMQQAMVMGKGYTEQLALMTKVVEDNNRVMERRAEILHKQLQAIKEEAEAGPAIDMSGTGGAEPSTLPGSKAPKITQGLPTITAQANKTQQAIDGLSKALDNMSGQFGKAGPTMDRFSRALQQIEEMQKKQAAGAKQTATAEITSYGEIAAGFIKNKRAQAIVMAVMETAKGLGALGAQDYEGAALDFASAAMYGVIADQSGGRSGGSAVGNVGGGAGPGGSDSGQGVLGGGSSGKSGSGDYHQTVVNVYGGGFTDTNNLQTLVTSLNQGGGAGTVRLNVAGTSATIPTPAY